MNELNFIIKSLWFPVVIALTSAQQDTRETQQNELDPNSNNQDSTTASPALSRTSPIFVQCNRNCPTSDEYRPVCGSDLNQYSNIRRIVCLNRCGQRLIQNWEGE